MRSLILVALALAFIAVISRSAVAAPQTIEEKTELARVHLRAGIAYYDDGRYEDAAREMQVAYELRSLPDLQYNLAQCYERLNQLDQAADAYEKYLAGGTAVDKQSVMARVANLRERAKAQKDGAPATSASSPTEKVVFKTIVVYKIAPPPPGRAARGAAYGLFVFGAGGIATGIAFGVLAKQASDKVTNGGNVAHPIPDDKALETQASGKTDQIVEGIGIGIGVAAIAGGIALYLIGNKIDKEAPKLTFAPSFGPNGGGATFTGRF